MQTGREEIEQEEMEKLNKFCISSDPLSSEKHTAFFNVTVTE